MPRPGRDKYDCNEAGQSIHCKFVGAGMFGGGGKKEYIRELQRGFPRILVFGYILHVFF